MPPIFHEIRSRDGILAAVHKRVDRPDGGKVITWLRPGGSVGLDGTPTSELPLYGVHRLSEWPLTSAVVVVEGEKVAEALWTLGIPAVGTVTGAASTPSADVLADLAGRAIILAPDNDDVGRGHMRRIGAVAAETGAVGWLEPSDGQAKGWDLADAIAEGLDVRALLTTAKPFEPSDRSDRGPHVTGVRSPTSLVSPEMQWPEPLAAEARHGFAGRYLAVVAPTSEADPAAILFTLLSTVGAMVGDAAAAIAGDAPHPARLYVLIVGPTGKGRKDTAARPARRLALLAESAFGDRIVEGLSSGEGLIYAVRDPIEKLVQVGRGEDRHSEVQTVDEGVADKRLLVRESEFAQVLRVSQRDGNILSPVVRRAWESGELRTLTRNNPVTATGAHVVVAGNITREELLRWLDRTEVASGFINRFLLCAARRVQVLPDGEGVADRDLEPLAAELRAVLTWARVGRRLHRDEGASEMWRAVYPELSEGQPGLLGAATNRAEAQVLRLSVLYAILDRAEVIRREHLIAALAVWQYAAQSARWVFGDAIGDPIADALLTALHTRGSMSRTDIRDLFGRHVERSRIEHALVRLEGLGRVTRSLDKATGGRPKEIWHVG